MKENEGQGDGLGSGNDGALSGKIRLAGMGTIVQDELGYRFQRCLLSQEIHSLGQGQLVGWLQAQLAASEKFSYTMIR